MHLSKFMDVLLFTDNHFHSRLCQRFYGGPSDPAISTCDDGVFLLSFYGICRILLSVRKIVSFGLLVGFSYPLSAG